MAIVNHVGGIVADETWLAADEHHVTGSLYYEIGAGSLGNPVVVTIEAGVIINVDGDFNALYGFDTTSFGKTIIAGTEANKVVARCDPTIIPYPQSAEWVAIWQWENVINEWSYFEVRNATAFMAVGTSQAGLTYAHAHSIINNCKSSNCLQPFMVSSSHSQNVAFDDWFTIDGILVESPWTYIWAHDGAPLAGFTGTNWIKNFAIMEGSPRLHPAAWSERAMLRFNAARTYVCKFDGFLIGTLGRTLLTRDAVIAGQSRTFHFKNVFASWSGGHDVLSSPQGVWGLFRSSIAYRRALLTVEDSIFWHCSQAAVLVDVDVAGEDVTVQYCDFIENCDVPFLYFSNLSTFIHDNCYYYGNYLTDMAVDSVDPQPGHLQWFDWSNAQAPTNVQYTPVFPLDTENVVESGLGADEITIGFDSKTGGNGKRLRGIPFVEYGLVSGGPYPSRAGNPPFATYDRYKAFAKWDTSKGTFATSGHSVTLTGLKPGTTYYYKPCFLDPLGRIAEGAEGNFTTLSAGVEAEIVRRV